MATKKCSNGHVYDASIYGDNCPFCPPSRPRTRVITNESESENPSGPTKPMWDSAGGYKPTQPMNGNDAPGGGRTVISHSNSSGLTTVGGGSNRLLVGVIVSFSHNSTGEVYPIYEGKNKIGRSALCDISFPNDERMSSEHLIILYREAEGVYWLVDQNTSNGTYVNGTFASERVRIKTNDIIVAGKTKLMFLAIPNF